MGSRPIDAISTLDASDHRLLPPAALKAAARQAGAFLTALGVEASNPVVRRCDPAAELLMADAGDGLKLLRAFAGGAYAGGKRAVYDRCETGASKR